jgi:uncharacterized Zn-binding protein involved in type VI secretion
MSRPFIRLGDSTSHGGTVTSVSVQTDVLGIQVARIGDKTSCPIPGHGSPLIITGDPTLIVDGSPVARHGDETDCGAILISSQQVTDDLV